MKLDKLLERLDYTVVQGSDSTEVTTLINDSRKVEEGSVFVCISGAVSDGHKYAADVAAKGAAAVVVEKDVEVPENVTVIKVEDTRYALALMSAAYFGYPADKMKVIGITGTKGKTTTTYMIKSILEETGHKVGLIGTIEAIIGDKKIPACNTTPESYTIHKYFAEMVEAGCDCVVMEVSSHALAQHRVDFCDFNGAVFTNLTQDHLDFHITMNNYFKAKAILFENLVAGDFAVINKDDEYSERFINAVSPTVSLYTYGIKNDADIKAKDVVFNHSGASFTCIVKDREYKVNLKMNGMFSVYNVLAALTTALALGMDIEKSIKTLEEIGGVAGRFEVIVNKPTVIVDYAHTPDGLENVLKAARDITPSDGRLICLFGCGGDRDATKRPKMGAIAEELADVVIVTSDNPRSEEPQQIITDILAGLKSVNEVIVEPDRELAIKEAHKIARENDVVLIAGKGHEDYQILANETIHFDDREKAREIFI